MPEASRGPRHAHVSTSYVCVPPCARLPVLVRRRPKTSPNEWTWLAGTKSVSNANGQPGVYGTDIGAKFVT
jgi:hypothetical protein